MDNSDNVVSITSAKKKTLSHKDKKKQLIEEAKIIYGDAVSPNKNKKTNIRTKLVDSEYVDESALILEWVKIEKHVQVRDKACITGYAELKDYVVIRGNAKILGNAKLKDNAIVEDYARMEGYSKIEDHGRLFGRARLNGTVRIKDYASVGGNVELIGNIDVINNTYMDGDIAIIVIGTNKLTIDGAKYRYRNRIYTDRKELSAAYPKSIIIEDRTEKQEDNL